MKPRSHLSTFHPNRPWEMSFLSILSFSVRALRTGTANLLNSSLLQGLPHLQWVIFRNHLYLFNTEGSCSEVGSGCELRGNREPVWADVMQQYVLTLILIYIYTS